MLDRTRCLGLAAALAAVLVAAPALGATCDGVSFPDSVSVGGKTLVLNGMGIRKASFLAVKVYVAGLYLPAKATDAQKIADANQPWQLTLHLLRKVSVSQMRNGTDKGFKRATGDKLDTLQSRIDALKAQMTDLDKGQTVSYDYDPGTGTVMDMAGKTGTAIKGTDFASALLLATIGKSQPDSGLRTGLLGGACQ